MDNSRFDKDRSPGQLVETEIWVDEVRGGVPQKVPVRGTAFVPNPLPPPLDWSAVCGRLTGRLLEAQSNISRLDGLASRLPNPHLLLRPLLVREAMTSSEIEDIKTSMLGIALERAGARVENEQNNRLVLNYVAALDNGLDSQYPIGHKLVHDLHRILLSGVEGSDRRPGSYRDRQNMIGRDGAQLSDARFVPPPPGAPLEDRMNNLLQFMREPPDNIPALVATAIGHYQFEAIHPYEDGNGRVGRLLISLCLCRYGLLAQPLGHVSGYFKRHRREYYDALLAVSTNGEWENWIDLFLRAVASETKAAASQADRLFVLWRTLSDKVGTRRTSVLQRTLIDHLFDRPVVTVSQVCEVLDITDTAARRHISQLVELGVLTPDTKFRHPQIYVCGPIVELANRNE